MCSSCSFSPCYFSFFLCSFFHIYQNCVSGHLLLANQRYVWLDQLLVCLELEVRQDLIAVVLNHLWSRLPLGLGDFWSICSTDISVHYPYNYVVCLSVCSPCLHFTFCYYVLDNLQGTSAQSETWVLSAVVIWYLGAVLVLPQSLCAVL